MPVHLLGLPGWEIALQAHCLLTIKLSFSQSQDWWKFLRTVGAIWGKRSETQECVWLGFCPDSLGTASHQNTAVSSVWRLHWADYAASALCSSGCSDLLEAVDPNHQNGSQPLSEAGKHTCVAKGSSFCC